MKKIFTCRRTVLGIFGMSLLFVLGYLKGIDVSMAIATISIGVSASNAYQGKSSPPVEPAQE